MRVSKVLLTSHVTTSVAWLGAVAAFIAVAIGCLSAKDIHIGRNLYPALEVIAWYVIVPFCFASLATGVLQAITTPWGLFNHYWIVVKLILTVVMTALLMLHMNPISYLSGIANDTSPLQIKESRTLIDLIAKAGAAVIGLMAVTTISIYKPWGKVVVAKKARPAKPFSYYLLIALALIVLTIIIMHLTGGGMGKH